MDNKTVLITGAATRLGAVIARTLHAEKMDIIIHYNTSEQAARELISELNDCRDNSAMSIQADLIEPGAIQQLAYTARGFKNRLDVLINNASSFYPTPIKTANPDQWQDLVDTNMKIPFFLSQAVVPDLKTQNGCIINITDIHGQRPLRHHAIYSAAKAGLIMQTRTLAKDLAPAIRVNAVSPGAILWPADMNDDIKQKILSTIPAGRKGEPEDIAAAVLFLVENADYITGEVMTIDGGRSLSL